MFDLMGFVYDAFQSLSEREMICGVAIIYFAHDTLFAFRVNKQTRWLIFWCYGGSFRVILSLTVTNVSEDGEKVEKNEVLFMGRGRSCGMEYIRGYMKYNTRSFRIHVSICFSMNKIMICAGSRMKKFVRRLLLSSRNLNLANPRFYGEYFFQ